MENNKDNKTTKTNKHINPDKLFKNKTKCTTENYIEFLEFHNKKFNARYHAYTIFWSIVFFCLLIYCFRSGARLQGVTITIFLICFIAYRIMRPKMIVDNELKSDKLNEDNVNTYCFYDKEFTVENKKGKFRYKYFIIHKVYETNKFFYLYVSKENAFLLSKTAFSLGNSEDFAKFMRLKRKGRYKVVKASK